MQIKKAVFPIAGLGSRFLPATKANPKEMLPIVDKPLIQYAVEEAARAGIKHMIFITNASKRSIEDHFDKDYALESRLREQGKDNLLSLLHEISPPGIQFTCVRQHQPLGLGDAVLCAEQVVGDEPFVVLLPDDLIDASQPPCLTSMMEHFSLHGHSSIAVHPVLWSDVSQYGVVNVADMADHFSPIHAIVEKPKPEKALSNLAVLGRYLFTPTIFSCLKQVSCAVHGELQLTSGIELLMQQEPVHAYRFNGKHYDCGSKLGYLQATVELGMQHPQVGYDFCDYLKNTRFEI